MLQLKTILSSKRLDIWVMIALYGISLYLTTSNMTIQSDRALEYDQYLLIISGEELPYFDDRLGLVSSSLMATWLPAQVQKLTGLPERELFQVWPCLFFSLAPPFIYLLARKYLNRIQSAMAASLILANFYFLYAPNLGRVSIAWGILTVFVWALIMRRYKIAASVSLVLVFAHYGVSYITLGAVGTLTGYLLLRYSISKAGREVLIRVAIVLCVMGVAAGLWYFVGNSYTGERMVSFIASSVEIETSGNPHASNSIFDINSRTLAVQAAFGQTFGVMNWAQRIELIASWLVVIFVSYGLYLAIRGGISLEYKVIAIAMYGVTIVAVAIPYIDIHYGAIRTYFTALLVLAPCFIIGLNKISQMLKVNKYIIPSVVVIVCALTSSGILHGWLGYVK